MGLYTTYQYDELRYWSVRQESTSPTCRFTPSSASDISLAVLTDQIARCNFAVKSGGHAAFSGASNIEDGLTIDLMNLNQVEVSDDKTQTSIGPVVNPPILQNFTAVPGSIANESRITNLTNLTQEFNSSNHGGFSPTLMAEIVAIFMEETNAIKDATNTFPALVFQSISTAMTSHLSKNGGNALGISAADGPLDLINLSVSWSNETDDTKIFAAARNMVDRWNTTAYSQELGSRYLYQNYAALEQNIFEGYGEDNLEKLRLWGPKTRALRGSLAHAGADLSAYRLGGAELSFNPTLQINNAILTNVDIVDRVRI
ncbi:hypothetical protein G7Y89_g3778 [Cudoniella acicularis]|uniref:FAD-binding PCMH-type domain-containing protein n=1 Tax=Cudoniella acicularis TaxID=354080 RepID=A0A8H4RTP4_9HELO|nr:hypothetical protein G7Y89_g3778 [Cudoniella acicularis]